MENIDDGEETAPSKRTLKVFRDYDKRAYGVLIARHIGLAVLSDECPISAPGSMSSLHSPD
jgi:hypothetical protein